MASDTQAFLGISGDTIVVLVSVAVGWLLAQLTDSIKSLIATAKHKKALLEELDDIHSQLSRIELAVRRQLHIAVLGGVEASAEIRLFNLYFENYYKDVFNRLSRSQRLSYQLIHGLVDSYNRHAEQFEHHARMAVEDMQTSTPDNRERLGRLWVDRIAAIYTNVRTLQWHVAYHLDNPRNPALDLLGPMHDVYVNHYRKISTDIEKIVESSKKMSLADFEFDVSIGDRLNLATGRDDSSAGAT